MKGIILPEKLPNLNMQTWFPESGKVECACKNIVFIQSSRERHDTIMCNKCDLVYEFWNNSDGTGLKFNIKGYFPFYPDGYKFTISPNFSKKSIRE